MYKLEHKFKSSSQLLNSKRCAIECVVVSRTATIFVRCKTSGHQKGPTLRREHKQPKRRQMRRYQEGYTTSVNT